MHTEDRKMRAFFANKKRKVFYISILQELFHVEHCSLFPFWWSVTSSIGISDERQNQTFTIAGNVRLNMFFQYDSFTSPWPSLIGYATYHFSSYLQLAFMFHVEHKKSNPFIIRIWCRCINYHDPGIG